MSRPENRQLPSVFQWVNIRLLTRKKNWTDPQRKMMGAAFRFHLVRGLVLWIVMGVVGWFGYERYKKLKADTVEADRKRALAEHDRVIELFSSYASEAKASQYTGRQGQRFASLAAVRKAVDLLPELRLSTDEQKNKRDELRDLAVSCLTLPDVRESDDIPENATLDRFRLDRYACREGQEMVVRQLPDHREVARLAGVRGNVQSLFAPDGQSLALVDDADHNLRCWRFMKEKAASTVAKLGAPMPIYGWEFSRDGRRLLVGQTGNPQGVVGILGWPDGKPILPPRRLRTNTHDHPATAISPDGRWLAFVEGRYGSPESRLVRVIDVDSGGEVAQLEHPSTACSLAWHPDGQTLGVGCVDRKGIFLWNVRQQKRIGELADQLAGEPYLAINTTGEMLSSRESWGDDVLFWHPYSGRPILRLPNTPAWFTWCAWDGRLAGQGSSKDGRWRLSTAEPSPVVRTLVCNPVYGREGSSGSVSVHPGGRLLAVGSYDGVSLFDLQTGQDVGRLPVGYTFGTFIPATGDLLTYSVRGLLRWPVHFTSGDPTDVTLGPPRVLPCRPAFGTQVASDRSGNVIAVTMAQAGASVLYDNGKTVLKLASGRDYRKVTVSPDGHWVAIGELGNHNVEIWDAITRAKVRRLGDGSPGGIGFCTFSPDGQWLSVPEISSRPLRVGTWDLPPSSEFPDTHVNSFSPDARFVLCCEVAPILRDAVSGSRLAALDTPGAPRSFSSTFTPDGASLVVSAGDLKATYVWDLRRLRRELSDLGLDWDQRPDPSLRADGQQSPAIPLKVQVNWGSLKSVARSHPGPEPAIFPRRRGT